MTFLDYSGDVDLAAEGNASLSEPLIVQDLLVTGCSVRALSSIVQIVGWVDIGMGDVGPERRINTRISLTPSAARKLRTDLGRLLSVVGN